MLIRCETDPSIERVEINGFKFPLGVYPVEAIEPKPGYRLEFEPADGPGDPQFGDEIVEPWPDRYVFDIVISADRVDALYRQLLPLLPGRVYPILDFIGHDAYREIDPYLARVPLGLEWLIDGVRACRPFFFEDGMIGFGALCDDPFCHMFVDEHKIMTVRCEPDLKPRFETVLKAFDLTETAEPGGGGRGGPRAPQRALDPRGPARPAERRGDRRGPAGRVAARPQHRYHAEPRRQRAGSGADGLAVHRPARGRGPDAVRGGDADADCLLHAEELSLDATVGCSRRSPGRIRSPGPSEGASESGPSEGGGGGESGATVEPGAESGAELGAELGAGWALSWARARR
jgi:hypothetical protein